MPPALRETRVKHDHVRNTSVGEEGGYQLPQRCTGLSEKQLVRLGDALMASLNPRCPVKAADGGYVLAGIPSS